MAGSGVILAAPVKDASLAPVSQGGRAGLLLAARSLLISADSIDYEVRGTLSLGS